MRLRDLFHHFFVLALDRLPIDHRLAAPCGLFLGFALDALDIARGVAVHMIEQLRGHPGADQALAGLLIGQELGMLDVLDQGSRVK